MSGVEERPLDDGQTLTAERDAAVGRSPTDRERSECAVASSDVREAMASDIAMDSRTFLQKIRLWIVLAVVVIAASVGIPYYLDALHHESTNDAFIEGHIVPISSRVAGHVARVYAADNQWVNQGDLLAELDSRDFEAKLSRCPGRIAGGSSGCSVAQCGRGRHAGHGHGWRQ